MVVRKTKIERCPLCMGSGRVIGITKVDGIAFCVNTVENCEACRGRGVIPVIYLTPDVRHWIALAASVFAFLAWCTAIFVICYGKKGG